MVSSRLCHDILFLEFAFNGASFHLQHSTAFGEGKRHMRRASRHFKHRRYNTRQKSKILKYIKIKIKISNSGQPRAT